MRSGRRGRNQVRHRFSLGKVHFAVQEGAAGELAGAGEAAARRQEPADQLLHDIPGSVAGDLHGVLAGVTVGRPEYGDQHVVQAGNLSVMDCISIGFRNGSAL